MTPSVVTSGCWLLGYISLGWMWQFVGKLLQYPNCCMYCPCAAAAAAENTTLSQ